MPPTAERPYDRGVPSEVARGILLRSGGLCEFGGCDQPAVNHCHLTPHRDGSPREIRDLVAGCRGHHAAYDKGRIRFLGWRPDGLPTFLVIEKNEVLNPKPLPARYRWEAWPKWLPRALSAGAKRKLRLWKKRAKAAERAAERAAAKASGEVGTPGSPPRSPPREVPRSKPPGGADLARDRAPPGTRVGGDTPYAKRARAPTHDWMR